MPEPTTVLDYFAPAAPLDCGHPRTAEGHTAIRRTATGDRTLCDDCAFAAEVDDLRTADRHVSYLGTVKDAPYGDVHQHERIGGGPLSNADLRLDVSTWPGRPLMRVLSATCARNGFADMSGRRPWRWTVQAVDTHGQRWIGVGPGPGMYLRLRRAK